MHITAICPHCQSRYQLDPSLLGKRMRCPNTICQAVFEVRQAYDASPASTAVSPAKSQGVKGSVGEVVPVLPVENTDVFSTTIEQAAEPNDASFAEELGIPDDAEEKSPSPQAPIDGGAADMQPGKWQPPPVRRVGTGATNGQSLGNGRPAIAPPARSKPLWRRPLVVIAAMAAFLAAAAVYGIILVAGKSEVEETERLKKAREQYQNQDFGAARQAFQGLLRDYPNSKDRRQFDFLVELSAVRETVYAPPDDPSQRADALPSILQFIELYKNDPLLKEYHADAWLTLQRLARDLTNLAEERHEPRYLEQAKRSAQEAGKFAPPEGAKAAELAHALQADMARVDALLSARAARLELLDALRVLVSRPSADAVRAGRARARSAGLQRDPDVVRLLDQLVKAHRAGVAFTPAPGPDRAGGDQPVAREDDLPSFYAAPPIGKQYPRAGAKPPQPHVVFALARGVLYALDAATGDVLWLRRVGADTNLLPLRVSASLIAPEMALVISSDYQTIAGVTARTGAHVWRHALDGVCVGQPVLVDRHVFVPTLSGRVEEIETTGGRLQGFYTLGQPLPFGGVRQPGTSLVYFPADAYSVYVLDIAKRSCAAILYTAHAAGSLRGLPLIWNEARSAKDPGGGWLLLTMASGNDSLELRPYRLPIRDSDQKPAEPQVRMRGDSWFAPWHDGDKLALATSAGRLALYGIRLPGDHDPLLFPLLDPEYRLDHTAAASDLSAPGMGTPGDRALVVHADAQNYWVLAAGKLQRLEATFTAAKGPGLMARWPQPVAVGVPLHAAQVYVSRSGAVSFILVTQDADQPTCRVRAIAAEDGRVLWQRQLGFVCQNSPVAAGDAIMCSGATGSFVFDSRRFAPDKRWQAAPVFVAGDAQRPNHWTVARGAGFVQLAWGTHSDLRVSVLDGQGAEVHRDYPLPAPPQGTPALGSNFVLVPLANGIILRVPLPPSEGAPTSGPDWRGLAVDESQPCHLVALGNNGFAVTDGGQAIFRLHWDNPKSWEKMGSAELPRRITAAPALVGKRLLVADAGGNVSMLEGDQVIADRWSLGGKMTTAPFARGKYAGVIVDRNRLVWLDPDRDQPLWEYAFVAPIVGQPELIDGLLVVADLQGGIVALDPATGSPTAPGYHLKANEAPTATPLGFAPSQLFVPLMDGTGMVVPLAKVR